jgi:Ca2+-binding EF-hand superfamily protein
MLRSIALTAAAVLTLSPALAQSPEALPDRPITRAEVIAGLKRQFAAMDANHDGTISRDEFEAYHARQAASGGDAGPFAHVGSHWFDKADANGDGRVTLSEAEARPLQLFDMADADHDGTVSLAERKIALMMASFGK